MFATHVAASTYSKFTDLAIGCSTEVSVLQMLSTELLVVVNLAVGGDRNLAIFREKRLGARKGIDDGQTLMRQAHLSNDRKEGLKKMCIDYEARLAKASFVAARWRSNQTAKHTPAPAEYAASGDRSSQGPGDASASEVSRASPEAQPRSRGSEGTQEYHT
jgi:hypothetical protein